MGQENFFEQNQISWIKKSSLFDLNLAQASLHVNCQKGGGGKYKVLSKLDLEIH